MRIKNFSLAFNVAQKAYQQFSKFPQSIELIARAYINQNNYEEALNILQNYPYRTSQHLKMLQAYLMIMTQIYNEAKQYVKDNKLPPLPYIEDYNQDILPEPAELVIIKPFIELPSLKLLNTTASYIQKNKDNCSSPFVHEFYDA